MENINELFDIVHDLNAQTVITHEQSCEDLEFILESNGLDSSIKLNGHVLW